MDYDSVASNDPVRALPALIRICDESAASGAPEVTNWSSGTPPAGSSWHVDDMADACLHLLEHYDGPEQVNVGTGRDTTIKDISAVIAEVVGFTGETRWDTSKPDGTPQKLLDVSKLTDAGWTARIGLREGLESTVAWYREHAADVRV